METLLNSDGFIGKKKGVKGIGKSHQKSEELTIAW